MNVTVASNPDTDVFCNSNSILHVRFLFSSDLRDHWEKIISILDEEFK